MPLGFATLLRTCHATTKTMTTVLPDPVAILVRSRANVSPSDWISTLTRSDGVPPVNQGRVSAASNWQKTKRHDSNSSGSFE